MEKFGDHRPNSKHERILRPEQEGESAGSEPLNLSRRALLKGMFATAVAGAGAEAYLRIPDVEAFREDRKQRMRFERFDGLPPQEREPLIKEEVARFHSFLRSPEGKRIMNSGTPREIFALLYSLPPLLRKHVEGTSFEVPKRQWPSVAVGVTHGKIAAFGLQNDPDMIGRFYHGNGFYVGSNEFLTNWHVLKSMTVPPSVPGADVSFESPLERKALESGLDVVRVKGLPDTLIRPPSSRSAPIVKQLSPNVPDSTLNGSLVTLASIDIDRSANPDGTKLFPSVAVAVTSHMARVLAGDSNHVFRKKLENSHVYLLPPGEVRRRQVPSESGSRLLDRINAKQAAPLEWYGAGTSGSPIMMNGMVVGINHSGFPFEQSGVTLDLGFFHPMGKIRQAIRVGMEYDMKSPPKLIEHRNDYGSSSYDYGPYGKY